MEKIQIQAARIITGTNNYAHKNLLYIETGWEKLSKKREYHRLILLYKILNDLAPEHLHKYCSFTLTLIMGIIFDIITCSCSLFFLEQKHSDHPFSLLCSDCGTSSITQ